MAKRAMPSFSKSPPALVERFGSILGRYPEAQQKKMFGYPAAFIGGNMATGLFAEQWVVRLPAWEIDEARSAGAGPFEPMAGKPMKGFVVIPAADVSDDARIIDWVERGLSTARAMPAKR
jgi:hypothetical protein